MGVELRYQELVRIVRGLGSVAVGFSGGADSTLLLKVVGTKKVYPTPTSPEMPITVEALPPRYNDNTQLQLEVTSGTVEKDFDLKTDPR